MTVYKRLAKVQEELKAPKSQYNSFGKYNYRSAEDILEAVKPLCHKHGLALKVSDTLECIGDRYYVKARATIIDIESLDETGTTAFAREEESKKGMDGSQITGTASSYARKYALNGLFCIDDTKDADTDEHAKQTGAETKVSVKDITDAAKLANVEISFLLESYNKKHNKDISDLKFIPQDGKQAILQFLKGKVE